MPKLGWGQIDSQSTGFVALSMSLNEKDLKEEENDDFGNWTQGDFELHEAKITTPRANDLQLDSQDNSFV